MRILHVLAERGFSGGENQLRATLAFLQEQGHEQVLILNRNARFQAHAEALGLQILEQRICHNFDLLAAVGLRRRFRSLRPDLIHFTCSRSHKVGALACLGAPRLPPRVVTRRMDYPLRPGSFRRWLYGRVVSAVVVISEAVREQVHGLGIDPGRVHLIHEGVDTKTLGGLRNPSRRQAARQALDLGEEDIFGLTLASLHRRKGQDLLLDALARVQLPAGKRLVWLLGGEGPARPDLEQRARALEGRVELRIRIPGQVDDVHEVLAAADLFCLPSRLEGLGVALLEALATGIPCIAAAVGGMKEVLVSGESGLHFPVGDVDALAGALERLLADPGLARALGQAGQKRAEQEFDMRRMGEQTEQLYLELVGKELVGKA